MALRSSLEAFHEAIRRPSYREYLWEKLGRQLRILPTSVQYKKARLSTAKSMPTRHVSEILNSGFWFRDRLHEKSPYEGLEPQLFPDDLQGWGSDAPVLVEAIRLLRPRRICEVGSWKGRSAINMARVVKKLNLEAEIVCVDTWLGSPEHWLKQEPGWHESLRVENGMPQLYSTFLANVVRAKMCDIITPFPATSENAAVVFEKHGVKFDLVYVDGAHEYESAKRDISLYYSLLGEDALLIGDDYAFWPGVTKAADEFAVENNLHLTGAAGKFVIPKGEKYADVTFV